MMEFKTIHYCCSIVDNGNRKIYEKNVQKLGGTNCIVNELFRLFAGAKAKSDNTKAGYDQSSLFNHTKYDC